MKADPSKMKFPMVVAGDLLLNGAQYNAGDYYDAETEEAARYLETMHIAKKYNPRSAPKESTKPTEVDRTDEDVPTVKAIHPAQAPISIGEKGTTNVHVTTGENRPVSKEPTNLPRIRRAGGSGLDSDS